MSSQAFWDPFSLPPGRTAKGKGGWRRMGNSCQVLVLCPAVLSSPGSCRLPGSGWGLGTVGPSQALSGGKLVQEQGACTEPGASSPSGRKLHRGPGVRERGAQLGCVTSLRHAWAEGKLPAGRNRLLLSLLLPDFTPRGRQELLFSWVPPRGL